MARVELSLIEPHEFERFVSDVLSDRARERAAAEMIPLESAKSAAQADQQRLLQEGYHSPGHRFARVLSKGSGLGVGTVWFQLDLEASIARVFHLRIWPSYRRKGFGLAAVAEIEQQAAKSGCLRVSLDVFEPNAAGQGLYRKLGYRLVSMNMHKSLWQPGG